VPDVERIELQPDEHLLTTAHASFRGATAASVRATFALGSSRMRNRAFDAWHTAALASGLPRVPPDMIVAVTDRRVLFGHPTFFGHAPKAYWSAVDLDEIGQIVAVRHGLLTGVAIAFRMGGVVELEALRGRRLRRWAETVARHLAT
jgi:hypothetical protein